MKRGGRLARRTPLKRSRRIRGRSDQQVALDRRWSEVRAIALARDGYRCRYPDCRRAAVDVHHVRTKGAHTELRFALDNLRSMCREHHDWCHANPAAARKLFDAEGPTPASPAQGA